MKKNRFFAVTASFTLLIFFLGSCVKDEIDLGNISNRMYWNPKIGIPVAYGNLTLEDLIEKIDSNKVIRTDADNFLTLVYTNSLFSNTAENIIKINNQNFNEVLLESSYGLPPNPSQDTIKLNRASKYNFSFLYGEVIDSVKLKAGTMAFRVSSTYKHRGTLKITVPKLLKDKIPFEAEIDINKADGTFTTVQNFDIRGYTLQLDHPNTTDNIISYNYTVKLVNSGAGISAGDRISIEVNITNALFSSIYGYIGNRQLLNTKSQFGIPLFNNVSFPDMVFADPLIKIRTASSFGVPASMELYDVDAVNNNIPQTVTLTFKPGTNPFLVASPVVPGTTARDTVIFDKTDTNLNEALSIGPEKITHGIRSFANPAGMAKNFVLDTSRVYVDMDIELPLELSMKKIGFVDTMDLDLSKFFDKPERVKSLLLHSSFENGLPADLDLKVYLLDENYIPVDTLFNPAADNVIKSGTIDQQGKVVTSTKKDIDIVFQQNRIATLKNVRYALVNADVATANGGNTFVKFYSHYTLKVQFGIQTEFEVKEN